MFHGLRFIRGVLCSGFIVHATLIRLCAASGDIDPTFDVQRFSDGEFYHVNAVAVLPNGNIAMGGSVAGLQSPLAFVEQYYPTGTLDNAFQATFFWQDYPVTSLLSFSGNSLLVGGDFTQVNGVARQDLALLSATAEVLPFGAISPQGAGVAAIKRLPDGRILVGGSFPGGLRRFHADGSVDLSFRSPLLNDVVAFDVDRRGRIVAAASVAYPDGTKKKKRYRNIVRLRPNGRLDPTFKSPFTFHDETRDAHTDVRTVFIEPDGHVIVGGTLLGKTLDPGHGDAFVRLNKQGRIVHRYTELIQYADDRFAGELHGLTIVPQPDGKILLGGFFGVRTNYEGGANIARLMPDGVTFDPGFRATADWGVGAIAFQADGKIIIGGDFSRVNGQPRHGIARLEP